MNCTTTDGGEVKFLAAALDSYSQGQANAYASGHDLGPDPYEGYYGEEPPLPRSLCTTRRRRSPRLRATGRTSRTTTRAMGTESVCRRDVLPIGWNPGCLLRSRGSWLDPDGSQTQPGRGGFTDATVHLARPERSPGGVDRRAVEAQPHPAPVLSLIAEVVAA